MYVYTAQPESMIFLPGLNYEMRGGGPSCLRRKLRKRQLTQNSSRIQPATNVLCNHLSDTSLLDTHVLTGPSFPTTVLSPGEDISIAEEPPYPPLLATPSYLLPRPQRSSHHVDTTLTGLSRCDSRILLPHPCHRYAHPQTRANRPILNRPQHRASTTSPSS